MADCSDRINPECAREFGTIKAKLEEHSLALSEIKTDLKSIQVSLRGNGREGLVTRVDRIEQRHSQSVRRMYGFIIPLLVGVLACAASIIALIWG